MDQRPEHAEDVGPSGDQHLRLRLQPRHAHEELGRVLDELERGVAGARAERRGAKRAGRRARARETTTRLAVTVSRGPSPTRARPLPSGAAPPWYEGSPLEGGAKSSWLRRGAGTCRRVDAGTGPTRGPLHPPSPFLPRGGGVEEVLGLRTPDSVHAHLTPLPSYSLRSRPPYSVSLSVCLVPRLFLFPSFCVPTLSAPVPTSLPLRPTHFRFPQSGPPFPD